MQSCSSRGTNGRVMQQGRPPEARGLTWVPARRAVRGCPDPPAELQQSGDGCGLSPVGVGVSGATALLSAGALASKLLSLGTSGPTGP